MADVRSLLRNERVSRRITHPNASYSATGKLSCSVCGLSLQSGQDSWNAHLKSTQHAMRAERLRLSQRPPAESPSEGTKPAQVSRSPNAKKRKAPDLDDDDSRKRNKPVQTPHSTPRVSYQEPSHQQDLALPPPSPDPVKAAAPPAQANSQPAIDEAEWAAFERDVATPPPPGPFSNQSIISAAPISASELAEQEEQKAKEEGKAKPDTDMEHEKEDAARALEQEFDEMEELETRVKRLREKREELRRKTLEEMDSVGIEERRTAQDAQGESSDEDEDIDDWGFVR